MNVATEERYEWTSGRTLLFVSLINFERLKEKEEEEVSWDQLYKDQGYTGKSYN